MSASTASPPRSSSTESGRVPAPQFVDRVRSRVERWLATFAYTSTRVTCEDGDIVIRMSFADAENLVGSVGLPENRR